MKLNYLFAAAALAIASCSNATSTPQPEPATTAEPTVAESQVPAETVAAAETEAPEAAPAEAPKKKDVVKDITNNQLPKASKKPVVIDCWATWCGPCMKFKPVYHEVAGEMSAKAEFYAADVDANGDLAQKLGISSIPTVVVILPGKKPIFKTGYMTKAEFTAYLKSVLK
ncbi:MAG: thioredoxin fold domain-containing protein [Paramuribaculum sp.]|nr:thioredoxin fold domain-containing protein [Paramuribaculum sp.]